MEKVSPAAPLTLDELSFLIATHRQWLRSGGEKGQKAELAGANLELNCNLILIHTKTQGSGQFTSD